MISRLSKRSLSRISIGAGIGFFMNWMCSDSNSVVENSTGIEFPSYIKDFTLLGIGVRQVTFINFNAYAVALYMQSKSILNLGSRWKQEYTPAKLLNPPESEFYISDLLKEGKSLKLVIKTARNTDGPHLRNGFLKMLDTKFKSQTDLSLLEKENVEKDLQKFKSSWPIKGTFKKGSSVVVTREENESLNIEFPDNPEFSGFSISNAKISQWFFKSYLAPGGVSESLRQSVSVGLKNVLS